MINSVFFHDKPVSIRLTDGLPCSGCDFEISKIQSDGALRVSIKNISQKTVHIKEIALFAGEAELSADTRFYGEGYHMLSQYRGTIADSELIGAYGDDKSFFHLPENPYDSGLNITYYLLELKQGETYTLIAFSSCHKFLGKFRFKENYLEAVMDTEDIPLYPGQSWDMEEIVVYSGACKRDLYDKLAEQINRNHPPLKWDTIPTGWCSYYCVGIMKPEDLYKNAEAMAKRIPELTMIQIDSGLQTTDGDWLTPRFDDDLKAACEKVRAKGVKAGGYCSPFVVDISSQLYADHKEWLVKDEEGVPTNRRSHKQSWCVLDGSHPEARAFLKKIVRYMHDDCGLRYFKLDFLSYGALPVGKRYNETATSVEAYRMGMRAIIEEVGHDSFILACNAPFWPTLGLAHGNRSTNDIFRDWKHVRGNALEQFYRNWQHGKLWINDPDCILLEKLDIYRLKDGAPVKKPCLLSDDEFEFHKAFAIACGGMILSGDLLYEISEANIEVLKKMMACMGEAAVFDDDCFCVGRFISKDIICLFNWEDSAKTITAELPGTNALFDFWTGEQIGVFTDSFFITLPAHGGMVIRFEKCIKAGRTPQGGAPLAYATEEGKE